MSEHKTTSWNPTPARKRRSRRAPWWLWRVACRLCRHHFWLPLGDGGMGYCRCSRPLPVIQTEAFPDLPVTGSLSELGVQPKEADDGCTEESN